MGYASKAGRARTSSRHPQAFAVCDRCGVWYNNSSLQWQYDYRGQALANIRVLVCHRCLDVPQAQLRAIAIPADPVPVVNARVEPFVQDEGGNSPVYGQPVGLDPNAVMPFDSSTLTAYGVPLAVLSVTGDGATTVTVTCSAPHGLSTNGQVAVEGLSNINGCGFYSVVVTTATAFTYATASVVPNSSLLTGTTRIITALVGLPYGVTTIPQGV